VQSTERWRLVWPMFYVEPSSSGVMDKKISGAVSCDFSTDTANVRQNSDRQLWIANRNDYRSYAQNFNSATKFPQNGLLQHQINEYFFDNFRRPQFFSKKGSNCPSAPPPATMQLPSSTTLLHLPFVVSGAPVGLQCNTIFFYYNPNQTATKVTLLCRIVL